MPNQKKKIVIQKRPFSQKIIAALFIILFAGIGTAALLRSQAAEEPYVWFAGTSFPNSSPQTGDTITQGITIATRGDDFHVNYTFSTGEMNGTQLSFTGSSLPGVSNTGPDAISGCVYIANGGGSGNYSNFGNVTYRIDSLGGYFAIQIEAHRDYGPCGNETPAFDGDWFLSNLPGWAPPTPRQEDDGPDEQPCSRNCKDDQSDIDDSNNKGVNINKSSTSSGSSGGTIANQQGNKQNYTPSTSSQGNTKQSELEPSPFYDGKEYKAGSASDSIFGGLFARNGNTGITSVWGLVAAGVLITVIAIGGYWWWRKHHKV